MNGLRRPLLLSALIGAIVLLLAGRVSAHEVMNAPESGEQRLYLGFSTDPSIAATIGYAIAANTLVLDPVFVLSVDLPLPRLLPRIDNLALGVRATLLSIGPVKLINRLGISYRNPGSPTLGFDETLLAGVFSSWAFVALEATLDHFAAVALDSGDFSWIGGAGGTWTWMFGLQGGITFAEMIEVAARLGVYNGAAGVTTSFPLFTTVAVLWHF